MNCESSHCRLNGCAFPQACPNDKARSIPSTPDQSGEPSTCDAIYLAAGGRHFVCERAHGHDGSHQDGDTWWRNAWGESTAPISTGDDNEPATHPILPPLSEMRYMTKEERAEFDAMGPQPKPLLCSQCRERPASSSTPPVSSPEKPEPRDYDYADPESWQKRSSLPTYEEVERPLQQLNAAIEVCETLLARPEYQEPNVNKLILELEYSISEAVRRRSGDGSLRWARVDAARQAIRQAFSHLLSEKDALYTGLVEVQKERDSYYREASKALAALEEARKGIAPLIEPVYHSEHGREWWEVLGVRHAGIVAAQDHAAAANAFAAMYTRELRRPRCSLEQSLETTERERDEARKELASIVRRHCVRHHENTSRYSVDGSSWYETPEAAVDAVLTSRSILPTRTD